MNPSFGIPAHVEHTTRPHRAPVRYVVVIDGDGSSLARLCLESRVQVGEFGAGSQEVSEMTEGLVPTEGARGTEWDETLASHTEDERAAAKVYTLDV